MGLVIKYKFESCCDCVKGLYSDTTGDYIPGENDGGFGGVNPESSAITNVTLKIIKPNSEAAWYLVFTIASNVVVSATRIDEYGDEQDVLSLLSTTSFPFIELELTNELMFGESSESPLESGAWFIQYSMNTAVEEENYTTSAYNYIICQLEKCAFNISKSLGKNEISIEDANEFFLKLDLLNIAILYKNKTEADNIINELKAICKNCGCC
jgi:hypothetical protein